MFRDSLYPVESDSLRYSRQFEVGEKNRSVALSCHGPNLLQRRRGHHVRRVGA